MLKETEETISFVVIIFIIDGISIGRREAVGPKRGAEAGGSCSPVLLPGGKWQYCPTKLTTRKRVLLELQETFQ